MSRVTELATNLVTCRHEKFGTLTIVREDSSGRREEEQSTCVDCGAVLVGSEWLQPDGVVRLAGVIGSR